MKEFITAKCIRPFTKQVRTYSTSTMRKLKKALAPHLKYLPSPFTTIMGEEAFVARVPVVMTTVPETPEVIVIGTQAYVRIGEAPLTYRAAISRRAVRTK